jgi:hypothetical protein
MEGVYTSVIYENALIPLNVNCAYRGVSIPTRYIPGQSTTFHLVLIPWQIHASSLKAGIPYLDDPTHAILVGREYPSFYRLLAELQGLDSWLPKSYRLKKNLLMRTTLSGQLAAQSQSGYVLPNLGLYSCEVFGNATRGLEAFQIYLPIWSLAPGEKRWPSNLRGRGGHEAKRMSRIALNTFDIPIRWEYATSQGLEVLSRQVKPESCLGHAVQLTMMANHWVESEDAQRAEVEQQMRDFVRRFPPGERGFLAERLDELLKTKDIEVGPFVAPTKAVELEKGPLETIGIPLERSDSTTLSISPISVHLRIDRSNVAEQDLIYAKVECTNLSEEEVVLGEVEQQPRILLELHDGAEQFLPWLASQEGASTKWPTKLAPFESISSSLVLAPWQYLDWEASAKGIPRPRRARFRVPPFDNIRVVPFGLEAILTDYEFDGLTLRELKEPFPTLIGLRAGVQTLRLPMEEIEPDHAGLRKKMDPFKFYNLGVKVLPVNKTAVRDLRPFQLYLPHHLIQTSIQENSNGRKLPAMREYGAKEVPRMSRVPLNFFGAPLRREYSTPMGLATLRDRLTPHSCLYNVLELTLIANLWVESRGEGRVIQEQKMFEFVKHLPSIERDFLTQRIRDLIETKGQEVGELTPTSADQFGWVTSLDEIGIPQIEPTGESKQHPKTVPPQDESLFTLPATIQNK